MFYIYMEKDGIIQITVGLDALSPPCLDRLNPGEMGEMGMFYTYIKTSQNFPRLCNFSRRRRVLL